jgi:hypothetical protein
VPAALFGAEQESEVFLCDVDAHSVDGGAVMPPKMAGAQERLAGPGEASEVRNLSDNAEARAQAEAAMYRMMVTPGAKRRGRGQRESAATTVRSSADGPRRNRNHQSKDSSANPAPCGFHP